MTRRRPLVITTGFGRPTRPPRAASIAKSAIEENSGTHDYDVLAETGWVYQGTPKLEITSHTGPGSSAIIGAGASSLLRVTAPVSGTGTISIGLRLRSDRNTGHADATFSVDIVTAATGEPWSDGTLWTDGTGWI